MWLTSQEAQSARDIARNLLKVQSHDVLAVNTALRKQFPQLSAEQINATLEQAQLELLAFERYGIDASALLLTRDGLEQGTRPRVAQLRAQLIKHAGAARVIDMSAGLGFDVRASLDAGLEVIAIERDSTTAAYLRNNAPQAQVLEADSMDVIDELLGQLGNHDVVFVDPARRSGRRTLDGSRAHPERDPERWSPPWSFVTSLAERGVRVCAKVAPGFSPALLPSGWSGFWTTVNRDPVEAMLCSWNINSPRTARMVDEHIYEFSGEGIESFATTAIGSYLHEPDPSVVNAGLLNDLCLQFPELHRIDLQSTWLTSIHDFAHPMVRTYLVDEVLPNDTKSLRKALIARNIGDVTIKCRGMNIKADVLRKELKLTIGTAGTIVITTSNGVRQTLLVHHHG